MFPGMSGGTLRYHRIHTSTTVSSQRQCLAFCLYFERMRDGEGGVISENSMLFLTMLEFLVPYSEWL